MHHPLPSNALSGSNSTPSVLPYGGRSTSVGPTVNTPSDSSISCEQPCGQSQLTHGILLQANECSDDGHSVLLYQARLWLLLLQQYVPDLAVQELPLTHVLLKTYVPIRSLLSSTNICHHMLPSFSDEYLLLDILRKKETGSQHSDLLWTGLESQPPFC